MLIALFGGMSVPVFWAFWFVGAIISYFLMKWILEYCDHLYPKSSLIGMCVIGWDFMWIIATVLFCFFVLIKFGQFIYEKMNP